MKYTTEQMAALFTAQGCELQDEYLGSMRKMKYRCRCGRVSSINWNHFSKGKRCGFCGKKGRSKKLTIEEARERFAANGCVLLEEVYRNYNTPMRFRCKCGRESKMNMYQVYQGQHCRECGLQKIQKENHPAWRHDREKKAEDDRIRKKCYKALRTSLLKTGQLKLARTSRLLGYTPRDLQEHVRNHPNYEMVKDGEWHLDHVFPIAAFVENGIKDMAIINALDNLQPLEGRKNITKGDTYDRTVFFEWLGLKGVTLP